jgi:hypothetical protein
MTSTLRAGEDRFVCATSTTTGNALVYALQRGDDGLNPTHSGRLIAVRWPTEGWRWHQGPLATLNETNFFDSLETTS